MVEISIITPTFNRHSSLKKCVQSLLELPNDCEIIIIDDGSTPPIKIEHEKIKMIRTQNKGPAHARNIGLENARGKYIAFIDDDVIPTKTWLEPLIRFIKSQQGAIGVSGIVRPPKNANLIQKAIYYLPMMDEGTLEAIEKNKPILRDHLSTTASLYKNVPELKFDTSLKRSQDLDMSLRLSNIGNLFTIPDQKTTVHHDYPRTLIAFIKRTFKSGRGGAMLMRQNPDYFGLKKIIIYSFPIYILLSIFKPWIILLPFIPAFRTGLKAWQHSKDPKITVYSTILDYLKYHISLCGIWFEWIKKRKV